MKEDLITFLAEALEMEPKQVRLDDKFRDYENYSSLSELSVLAMLNSEFGIEIEMSEFNKYITVEDLLKLVNNSSIK